MSQEADDLVIARAQDIPDDWRGWLRERYELQQAEKFADYALAASIPTVIVLEMLKDGIDLIGEDDGSSCQRAIRWCKDRGFDDFVCKQAIL